MHTSSRIQGFHDPALTALTLLTSLGLGIAADAGTTLENSSFETIGPLGPSTSFTGVAGAPSAAASWNMWNNVVGTITSQSVSYGSVPFGPPPGGSAGSRLLRVTTNTGSSGIGQKFLPFDSGPACSFASAWVYVLSGHVFVATGNGGFIPPPYLLSTTTRQWQQIFSNNTACPTNNFIIYADISGSGADFYVDLASFQPLPCSHDLNGDGHVNGLDLALLLGAWGSCVGCCPADFDSSGAVNGLDLAMLLGAWAPA